MNMNVSYGDVVDQLKHAGKLWYLVNPYESIFEFPHEVPDYQQQVWLPFFILIILEQIILVSKKKRFRLNDQITSLSHWMFQEIGRLLFRGGEYYAYIIIYERYRWWNLPWNSVWTWCVTAVGVDFCYYWVHRSNHEVHFLWAHHQVHHSSEEFNLAVGLRQSILQHWCNFMLYLPLALFIPPSHFIAHNQFNLIYQLWIHTTVIDDLGPLELIFNTPKHHRVHHGCNLYCLDKNYGGLLIIWDKLFGTFMEEKEKIIYGLVVSPQSFNPLYLQASGIRTIGCCSYIAAIIYYLSHARYLSQIIRPAEILFKILTSEEVYPVINEDSDEDYNRIEVFYIAQLIQKSLRMPTLANKWAVFWKGPSWFPGSPRLGLDEYKINVTSRTNYDNYIPSWQKLYILTHFCIIFYQHLQLYDETQDLGSMSSGFILINNLFALTAIGLLFDKSTYAGIVEFIRCVIYFSFSTLHNSINVYMYYVYAASCCMWILYFLCRIISNFTNIAK